MDYKRQIRIAAALCIALASAFSAVHHGRAHVFDPVLERFLASGGTLADICGEEHAAGTAPMAVCSFCFAQAGTLSDTSSYTFQIILRPGMFDMVPHPVASGMETATFHNARAPPSPLLNSARIKTA